MHINTLCFPVVPEEQKILLGLKKRGFGKGYWNGFGGKLNPRETAEQGAIRELYEECGMKTRAPLCKCALLHFQFADVNTNDAQGHVYLYQLPHKRRKFAQKEKPVVGLGELEPTGELGELEPVESEEMRPQWFSYGEIPYANMWEDDILWLPHVLAGKWVEASFAFDHKNHVTKYRMQIR